VLYAALTAKWPDGPAYGLLAAPHEHGMLCTPRQVRAGVPQAIDDVADRVLNPTPRRGAPIRTPAALSAALHEIPRPRSAPAPTGDIADTSPIPLVAPATNWRPSRTTRAVRVVVGAVLAGGLALLGWQIYQTTLGARGSHSGSAAASGASATPVHTLRAVSADDFDPPPGNGEEHSAQSPFAIDGNSDTVWTTQLYNRAALGGLKPGVGLVVDLGTTQTVREVRLQLVGDGTDLQIRATPADVTSQPLDVASYQVVAEKAAARSVEAIALPTAVRTRYVLVWFTKLPADGAGKYRGGIAEVEVRG
jgi:putative peptidoglycan lipid II flippase